MSRRKRGRITVQHQPTGVEKGMMRGMGLIHASIGIVFVVMSLTMIIPGVGLIGIPFLLGGGFFTFNGIRMLFGKNGMSHRVAYDVEQDMAESVVGMFEDAPASVQDLDDQPRGSAESRLLELRHLYDHSLITQEEYEAKKQEILNDL